MAEAKRKVLRPARSSGEAGRTQRLSEREDRGMGLSRSHATKANAVAGSASIKERVPRKKHPQPGPSLP